MHHLSLPNLNPVFNPSLTETLRGSKQLTSTEPLHDLGRRLHLLKRDWAVRSRLEPQHPAQVNLLVKLVGHLGKLPVHLAAVGGRRLLELGNGSGVVQMDLTVLAVVEVPCKREEKLSCGLRVKWRVKFGVNSAQCSKSPFPIGLLRPCDSGSRSARALSSSSQVGGIRVVNQRNIHSLL
jgi:hypothetical protein